MSSICDATRRRTCIAGGLLFYILVSGCGGPDGTEPPATVDAFSKYDALLAGLTIFVLAVFVGFEVITKVPPTLHTPLMSGSNAISGITLVGALLVAGQRDNAAWIGVLAVVFAMINVIGGFWVTHRMLSMFKR